MGARRDSEQHAQKPQPTAPDTGSPNSATGEPRRGPLTARSRLEIANRQLRTAADDMERFRQPIHRLRTLISAVDAAERELERTFGHMLDAMGSAIARADRPFKFRSVARQSG
jgi:hypothetical protein